MANVTIDPDILKAAGVGLRVLPSFVRSIQALFGKGNGAMKRAAVQQLTQDVILGTALGLGVSGDTNTAQVINSLAPAIGDAVDETVAAFHQQSPGWVDQQQT